MGQELVKMIYNKNMDYTLRCMIIAAQKGGEVLRRYFGNTLNTQQKTTAGDFRTQADTNSEKAILSILLKKFPDYQVFSEEVGLLKGNSPYMFIIDPLDGTNNFVLGVPNFSIAIALVYKEQIKYAVVYNPILKQLYTAQLGRGAYLGNKKLSVAVESRISNATIAYSCSYSTSNSHEERARRSLRQLGVKRVLSSWSPEIDFCLLAQGRLESVVSDHNEIYDYVAGKLIAHEAGAIITDMSGNKEGSVLAPTFLASNNLKIHRKILNSLSWIR